LDVELDAQEKKSVGSSGPRSAPLIRCGLVGAENLDVLQGVLEEGRIAAIDLKDVLIDEDAVKLLIAAQANGIELRTARLISVNWTPREMSQMSGEETQT